MRIDGNKILMFIFALMLTQSFDSVLRKNIENNILIFILDFICFVLFFCISLALDGHIFVLIMILILTGFIIFIYYDIYRFKECSGNSDMIIYPFLILSLYFYINQYIRIKNTLEIRKLADCNYSSFAKSLMFFCIMLSLSYRSTNMFIFSSLLFVYMLST